MKSAKRLVLMVMACTMLFGASIAQPASVDAATVRSNCCAGAAQINQGLVDTYHKHPSSTGAMTLVQCRQYKCAACNRVWIQCTSCGKEQ